MKIKRLRGFSLLLMQQQIQVNLPCRECRAADTLLEKYDYKFYRLLCTNTKDCGYQEHLSWRVLEEQEEFHKECLKRNQEIQSKMKELRLLSTPKQLPTPVYDSPLTAVFQSHPQKADQKIRKFISTDSDPHPFLVSNDQLKKRCPHRWNPDLDS